MFDELTVPGVTFDWLTISGVVVFDGLTVAGVVRFNGLIWEI